MTQLGLVESAPTLHLWLWAGLGPLRAGLPTGLPHEKEASVRAIKAEATVFL